MIRGVVGSIAWGYYPAAAVNGYTVTCDRESRAWAVRGTIVLADAFKLSQHPLIFEAPITGGRVWRWPILDPVPRVAGPFAVRLGAPLRGDLPYVGPCA